MVLLGADSGEIDEARCLLEDPASTFTSSTTARRAAGDQTAAEELRARSEIGLRGVEVGVVREGHCDHKRTCVSELSRADTHLRLRSLMLAEFGAGGAVSSSGARGSKPVQQER